MSDSDEFGGLEPTTPYVSRKRNPTVNASDSEAGPSRTALASRSGTGKRKGPAQTADAKKRRSNASSDEEEAEDTDRRAKKGKHPIKPSSRANNKQEVIPEEVEDEIEEIEDPHQAKPSKSKKPSKVAPAPVKARPKPKAKGPSKTQDVDEAMDVDDVEVLNVEEDDNHAQQELAHAINVAGKSGPGKLAAHTITKAKASQLTERIARLERENDRLKESNADLQRKLEEVLKVRNTEPELLLQRLEAQIQEERQVRETLIKNLQDQVVRQDPFLRSGKKAAFEVLTRDEHNNEVKALHKQLEGYRSTIKEQQTSLQSKDQALAELQTDKQLLRTELNAEIERSKQLASRAQHAPPSVSRQRIAPPNEDPKFGTVIRFYEDLTNLIIPSMRMFPGKHSGMDEWHLTCFYTYKDVVSNLLPPKSLNFNLRLCHEPANADSQDANKKEVLVESVHYTPLGLEKESQEFRDSLDYLKDSFTFERDQLALFIRSLHDALSGGGDDNRDNDGDESS